MRETRRWWSEYNDGYGKRKISRGIERGREKKTDREAAIDRDVIIHYVSCFHLFYSLILFFLIRSILRWCPWVAKTHLSDYSQINQTLDYWLARSPIKTLLLTKGCAARRLMQTITNEGPKSEITCRNREFPILLVCLNFAAPCRGKG